MALRGDISFTSSAPSGAGFARFATAQGDMRSMGNLRLLGSAASLLLALTLLYCALFYVPAYVNAGRIKALSSEGKVVVTLEGVNEDQKRFTPYLDVLRLRRGYFLRGQLVQASLVSESAASLTLHVERCGEPLILQVFSCTPVASQTSTLSVTKNAHETITIETSGFYRVREVSKDGVAYAALWRRG